MNWRTMKLMMLAAMLMPALAAAAIRIVETNGGTQTVRFAAGLVIRADGVYIVPDAIFSDGF